MSRGEVQALLDRARDRLHPAGRRSAATLPRSTRRWSTAVVVGVLVALPILVAAVVLLGQTYVPIGDEAAILFRADQVGSAQTPLVGSYSTKGWTHPGPILFYFLSIPLHIFGGRPEAALVAAVLLDLAAVGAICYLAWRRRGLVGLAVVGAALATLLHGLGPETVVSIWNPYVPLLLYLVFLLSLWSIAEGDRNLVPLAAGLGTVVVQMHVSYVPLVLVGAASVAGSLWLRRKREPGIPAPAGPVVRRTVIVLAVLWAPPLVDLVFGTGNLGDLVAYFWSSSVPTAGPSTGFRMLGAHLSVSGPWSGGDPVFATLIPLRELGWVLLLGGLFVAGAFALWRRRSGLFGLPVLALGQLLAAGLAVSRAEDPVDGYVVAWLLPLAAFCWAAAAVTAVDLVRARGTGLRVLPVVAGLATTAILAFAVVSVPAYARAAPPQHSFAPAVTNVLDQLEGPVRDGDVVRVEGIGDTFNRPWVGVLYGLTRRDLTVYTSDGAQGEKWGRKHRWTGQSTNYTLTVAVTEEGALKDSGSACASDPRYQQLAVWNRLSDAERQEMDALLVENFRAQGKLSAAPAERLTDLRARSLKIVVYRGVDACRL